MGSRNATQSSPVLCRGTAWGCCPSPHAESGLRAGRPVCQERGAQLHVCAAGLQQTCARFSWLRRQVCAERRKDSSCSCCRADARDAALVLAVRRRQASATQMALLLRGLPAQRHRSASLVEEEPASREAPQQHISRHPRSAVLVETLCPCEEELQPVKSCSQTAALGSPAPCCLRRA